MAPKGKLAKENAVPQNDNVPTAINVVNQEPPASTTSITTATSEVATPKTKLNTSQWVKISLKKCLLSRKIYVTRRKFMKNWKKLVQNMLIFKHNCDMAVEE